MSDGFRGNYRGGWRGGGGRGQYNDDGYQERGGRGGRGYQGRGGYQGGYQDRYQGGPDGGYQGGRGGGYQGGYEGGYRGGYQPRGGGRGGGRNNESWGRGGGRYNRQRPPRNTQEKPAEDVVPVTELKQHTKQVTCLCYDTGTQQLYSGSSDGIVAAWDHSGALVSSDNVMAGIDCILVEAGYMFVGMHKDHDGQIKVYNLGAGGASHVLTGHKGAVNTLAVGNGTLFSGGQDASVRVWSFNQATGTFSQQVVLTYATHDGHQAAVMSILVSGPYMFSADQGGHIKVWDLASGSCCQTVNKAHEGAITKLALYGDSALLSGGLDGTVRCWCPGAAPSVLSEQPDYVFRGEQEDEQQQQQRQQQRNPPPIRSSMPGVITMELTQDPASTPVLMVACVGERQVRLLEVPSFSSRGVITNVKGIRALACVPPAALVAGEDTGAIKVFQWKS